MSYKIFFVLSVLAAIVSLFLVSEATAGVWLVGVACLLGIFSRLAQAEQHHNQIHGDKPEVGDDSGEPKKDPNDFLSTYT